MGTVNHCEDRPFLVLREALYSKQTNKQKMHGTEKKSFGEPNRRRRRTEIEIRPRSVKPAQPSPLKRGTAEVAFGGETDLG